jgi:hypothetical protein
VRKFIFILFFLVSSCVQPDEKAWIVVKLSLPSGAIKKMAFHNPGAPNATLEECKAALPKVLPELVEFIKSEPRFEGVKLLEADCVMAIGDPLKVIKTLNEKNYEVKMFMELILANHKVGQGSPVSIFKS